MEKKIMYRPITGNTPWIEDRISHREAEILTQYLDFLFRSELQQQLRPPAGVATGSKTTHLINSFIFAVTHNLEYFNGLLFLFYLLCSRLNS